MDLKTLDGVDSAFNGSTYWLIGDALLFFQSGLDPNESHNISLVNTGNAAYYALSLNDITLYQVSGASLSGRCKVPSISQSR